MFLDHIFLVVCMLQVVVCILQWMHAAYRINFHSREYQIGEKSIIFDLYDKNRQKWQSLASRNSCFIWWVNSKGTVPGTFFLGIYAMSSAFVVCSDLRFGFLSMIIAVVVVGAFLFNLLEWAGDSKINRQGIYHQNQKTLGIFKLYELLLRFPCS